MRGPTRNTAHSVAPTVNLLSPWVLETLETRRLRRRFVAAGCGLVLLVGAGWALQELRVRQAEELLTVEHAETTRLTAETTKLAPVRVYVATVETQKKTVHQAMQNEVLNSRVFAALQKATPRGAQVESVILTVTPPPPPPAPAPVPETGEGGAGTPAPTPAPTPVESPCPGPDPFNTRVVIGCLTLSGTADSRATVGTYVINLGDERLFVEPFISTTTTNEGDGVLFTGTVGLSEASFSGRYDDIEKLLQEEVSP
jgi:Tfp pilus assembly protein PilN